MNNVGFALDGAWKVLLAGLLLGAGLPALFAVGIRSLAWAAGGDAEVAPGHPIDGPPVGRRPGAGGRIGTALAVACFVAVLAAIALGITFLVGSGLGKSLSFEHVWPMLVDRT